MEIAAGQNLLQYRLIEKIGEGGMGVVWKAADTTLGREVAIKILPEIFARDAERLARFEREARLLASVNHPGIAAVHGLHAERGIHFLAMELVAGEDLARRLAGGPLGVEEALFVGVQVAEALEAAHGQGVIHRDLKPANVVLAPDGKTKVLDFGLAKALEPEGSSSTAGPTMSPTITSAGTALGAIIGTAAYMSPEQARGKPVDRRADVWSFGCLLYECLTAHGPFRGESVSDALGAILHKEPDWSLLPAATPPTVRLLLRRCLTKNPGQRLHDIADARIELEHAIEDPEGSALGLGGAALATADPRASRATRARQRWTLAGAAVLSVAAGLAAGRLALAGTRGRAGAQARPRSGPRSAREWFARGGDLTGRLARRIHARGEALDAGARRSRPAVDRRNGPGGSSLLVARRNPHRLLRC